MTAIEAIGGTRPLDAEIFANRAYSYYKNPRRNPVKEILDSSESYDKTPPFLGIFNDVPWYKLREDEVISWAKAGFSFIINDGEHMQWEGYYGREQNAMESRLGLLPIQRLHREARSAHGDSFQLGALATMRPYSVSLEEVTDYYNSINFPTPGDPKPESRGAYPVRGGDREFYFTPKSLRDIETEVQGWVQFETAELIIDENQRNKALDIMQEQGPNKACGFVGPFDLILREGELPNVEKAVENLFIEAAKRKIHMGRVVGSGSINSPKAIEDAMVRSIELGVRFISVHYMTTDLVLHGAMQVAEPFFKAAERCGF